MVEIVHSPKRQTAYYLGLMRCSRLWMCPVCARKITEQRRLELDELIARNVVPVLKRSGKDVFMVPKYHLSMLTFTLGHEWDEPAAGVLSRLARAYARFAAGRWYQGFKQTYFIVGTLRALEMTHGEHGWHPHYHLLVFHDSYIPSRMQVDYIASVRLRWSSVVFDIGGKTDIVRGVDLLYGKAHKYVLKLVGDREIRGWGMAAEVTKAPVKHAKDGNRSLNDLLLAYAAGDVEAGELWIEAAHALTRQKHLYPSKGLWNMLGRGVSTDEAAAEDITEATDRVLASLNWLDWQCIIRHDARGRVLHVAGSGNADELWNYLETLGIQKPEAESAEALAPYLDYAG
jgi:hypothetical protein